MVADIVADSGRIETVITATGMICYLPAGGLLPGCCLGNMYYKVNELEAFRSASLRGRKWQQNSPDRGSFHRLSDQTTIFATS